MEEEGGREEQNMCGVNETIFLLQQDEREGEREREGGREERWSERGRSE